MSVERSMDTSGDRNINTPAKSNVKFAPNNPNSNLRELSLKTLEDLNYCHATLNTLENIPSDVNADNTSTGLETITYQISDLMLSLRARLNNLVDKLGYL